MSDAPALSIVVAASESPEALAACLASMKAKVGAEVECIVAASIDRIPPPQAAVAATWVVAAPGTGVPRLRALGLERCRGAIVVFTEDSCRFECGWVEAWHSAFRESDVLAATGAVEHDESGSTLDWAVFFCEYAPFLLPADSTDPSRLAGNNFAVRRDWIATQLGPIDELHESDLPAAVHGVGGLLAFARGAAVRHTRRFELREALADRLRLGFEFGRHRAGKASKSVRVVAVWLGPAILGSQLLRLVATLVWKRRHLGRLTACLPLTAVLLTAWSVGEWLGWLSTCSFRAHVGRRDAGVARTPAQTPGRAGFRSLGYRPSRSPA